MANLQTTKKTGCETDDSGCGSTAATAGGRGRCRKPAGAYRRRRQTTIDTRRQHRRERQAKHSPLIGGSGRGWCSRVERVVGRIRERDTQRRRRLLHALAATLPLLLAAAENAAGHGDEDRHGSDAGHGANEGPRRARRRVRGRRSCERMHTTQHTHGVTSTTTHTRSRHGSSGATLTAAVFVAVGADGLVRLHHRSVLCKRKRQHR